jgi:hypothetical protein
MEWISIVVGSAIGLGGWLAPRPVGGRAFKKFVLEVSNTYPVYESPMESRIDHNITVTFRNRSGVAVQVTSWGINTPGNMNIVAFGQPHWGTQLPAWIQPSSSLSLHMDAKEIRRVHDEANIGYNDMKAWVDLADGRRVKSRKGVPLK